MKLKYKYYSLPVKTVLVVAAILLAGVVLVSTLLCICLLKEKYYYYSHSESEIVDNATRQVLDHYNTNLAGYYIHDELEYYHSPSKNYYYEIRDANGAILAGNVSGVEVLLSEKTVLEFDMDPEDAVTDTIVITGYLAAQPTGLDEFAVMRGWASLLYRMRYAAFVLLILSLLLEIGVVIFLLCSAGRHPGEDQPRLNPLDKLPFELVIAALALLLWMTFYAADVFWFLCIPFGILFLALLLWSAMSFAARLKTGSFLRTCLLGRAGLWIGRKIRLLFSGLPLVWKCAVLLAAACFAELLFLAGTASTDGLLFLWVCEKVLLIPFILLSAISLYKLREGGKRMAQGEIGARVESRWLIGPFKDFGVVLNSIGNGLNQAVEERMKSERFKTELITNVSHDIKTPLTSIISYVDLLKKADRKDEETIDRYLEVLDRQSARLKKLIDDLIEASKASTGNLAVHPEPCNAGVLLSQILGEYDARLQERELEPVLHQPDEEFFISADPRHLWRILDNLMSNALKYAQAGTRVYLDLSADEREVTLVFRNISREALHISGEELMNRFVRGDSSRSTEGSGLGLSIARSLAELQGGTLAIVIDGDLFKAILKFPRIPAERT